MTGALLLGAVGVALVVLALVQLPVGGRGPGFARLERWPRITAAAAGALSVSAAAVLLLGDDTSVPPGPVSQTIVDELGPGQVREEVRLFIDGKEVGVLRIDERTPVARLVIKVARAGTHAYRTELVQQLEGKATLRRTYSSEVVIDGEHTLEIATASDGAHLQTP